MSTLDIAMLLLVGGLALRGAFAGFVTESLSLAALIVAVIAVRLFHAPATGLITGLIHSEYGGALIAFVLIFALVFGLGKAAARMIGGRTKRSVLGPVDRLLGLGFGAVKGLIVATICFVLFTISYDALYGIETPRPDWLRLSRAFPLLSASSAAMSEWIAESSRTGGLINGFSGSALANSVDNATDGH